MQNRTYDMKTFKYTKFEYNLPYSFRNIYSKFDDKPVTKLFGSNRSSSSANVRLSVYLSVCVCGTKLSREVNLHLLRSESNVRHVYL